MSVLSDSSIAERCQAPSNYFDQEAFDRWVMSNPPIPLGELGKWNTPFWNDVRDRYTRELSPEERAVHVPMIAPFVPELVREVLQATDEDVKHGMGFINRKIISMGLSSYGYDVSLDSKECWLFTNIHSGTIDPKRFSPERCLTPMKIETDAEDGAQFVVMPPNSYMLANTVEYFHIPRDIMVICVGKSTYARCGAQVNVTPIEPGFEGNVVIEIANSTNSPMRIYLQEGIAQFIFLQGDRPANVSYGDRGGKYQGQTGVQLPKV